jgi:hypothetical protein
VHLAQLPLQALSGFGTVHQNITLALERVERDVQTQLNIVNLLYSDMANVFLTLARTHIKTSVQAGDEAWNQEPLDASQLTGANRKTYGCPLSRSVSDNSDYQATLTNFGNWRQSLPAAQKFALWHLLTNCYRPAGTVGLGYIGSTCSTNHMGASWASLQNEGACVCMCMHVCMYVCVCVCACV